MVSPPEMFPRNKKPSVGKTEGQYNQKNIPLNALSAGIMPGKAPAVFEREVYYIRSPARCQGDFAKNPPIFMGRVSILLRYPPETALFEPDRRTLTG